jgi:hypothetical protein
VVWIGVIQPIYERLAGSHSGIVAGFPAFTIEGLTKLMLAKKRAQKQHLVTFTPNVTT